MVTTNRFTRACLNYLSMKKFINLDQQIEKYDEVVSNSNCLLHRFICVFEFLLVILFVDCESFLYSCQHSISVIAKTELSVFSQLFFNFCI